MNLTQYVNLLIGTSTPMYSGYAGNIAPGAQVPFGMVNFGPDMPRSSYNGSGGYLIPLTATQGNINSFSVTHLNGPGCPGAGVVGMMPASTARPVANQAPSSTETIPQGGAPNPTTFLVADETVAPGYYSTLVNKVRSEFTATTRTGMARFTYPDKDSGFYALDTRINGNTNGSGNGDRGKVQDANVSLDMSPDGKVLQGKTVHPAFCTPWGTYYTSNTYFYMEFDKPMREQDETTTVNTVLNNSTVMQFDLTDEDLTVNMRVGISSVSIANAKENLKTENAANTFDEVRAAASQAWNERLNTVQVDMAADPTSLTQAQRDNLTKFYTALYRIFVSPTVYSDVNGEYRSMAEPQPYRTGVDRFGEVSVRPTVNVKDETYVRPDGTIGKPDAHYSGLSMWDTYRSAAQALTLFDAKQSSDVVSSLVASANQCGAFPHWVDGSDDSTPMAGDNAIPVIAASYAFGAKDFDLTAVARLMKQSSFDPTSNCNGNASNSLSPDRNKRGIPDLERYLDFGYKAGLPEDHPASATIEYVAGDHAAATFLSSVPSSVLDDPSVNITTQDIAKLTDRGSWWRNIYNADLKRLQSRLAPTVPGTLGAFQGWSNELFHEQTEVNYFWSFGYAWTDLINLLGKRAAKDRLNALFAIDDELTKIPLEYQLNGGQSSPWFYMGNEPSMPAPWAYNWVGSPASTQYILQRLMKTTWRNARDGLPGNDDYGTMSAWYVFATLGLFPVSQADAGFAISTPQFPAMTVQWGENKLRFVTDADPETAPFIESMSINGVDQPSSWVDLSALTTQAETEIQYTLSSTPTSWATDIDPRPAATSETTLSFSAEGHVFGTAKPANAIASVLFSDAASQPGVVEFRTGETLLGTAPLAKGGAAVLPIPSDLAVGSHAITATYVSDDETRAENSTSPASSFAVYRAATWLDFQVLQVLLDIAGSFDAVPDRWTVASYTPLRAALEAARELLTLDDVRQDELIERMDLVVAGLRGLVQRSDIFFLTNLIAKAEQVVNDGGAYQSAHMPALVSAITAAKVVVANTEALQAEVNAAFAALLDALEKVHKLGDKAWLGGLVGIALEMKADTYTPASWALVANALRSAQTLLAKGEASAYEIEDAAAALKSAINGLVRRDRPSQGGDVANDKDKDSATKVSKFTKTPKPKIRGKAIVGRMLKAKTSAWTPKAKFGYQWYRNGKAIAGATKAKYKVSRADRGAKLSVKVTGSKDGFQATAKQSKKTPKVK